MQVRSKAIFWLLLVFLSGAVLGAFFSYAVVSPPERRDRGPGGGGRRQADLDQVVAGYAENLDLDEEQRARFREIIDDTFRRYREVSEKHSKASREERAKLRKESRDQIRAILRPEQTEKYEELIRRHDKRFHRDNQSSKDRPR